MSKELAKVYDPTQVEDKWYKYWEENKFFHGDVNSEKPRYSIVIPPPNVTGMLTMGHILNNTIQDFLIRYKKMQGFETMWMPGTDHAGIATQNKVEAQIAAEGTNRHELGRAKLIERVWEWKEKYGGIIFKQLRKLGAACDWDRECFTMDEDRSKAVREVFVELYERGLIYRGNRLINWCPRCHTALADEEVENKDENGGFYQLVYPLADGSGEVVVATTRPETMLGDTAVAVHPKDERYTKLIGKMVKLPLTDRKIPIVADEHADPEKGSGAVKITPAHDFNDFMVGERQNLPRVNVLTHDGKMNENAPEKYQGMDRFDARKAVLKDLKVLGLVRDVEQKVIAVPRCYRCDNVVEPYLSDQWFVKMQPLAKPAIEAVRSGKIKFYPKHWEETYFYWMENIRDWCISRQIWWGHRIPVWYCDDCNHMTVSRHDPDTCEKCGSKNIRQDDDVLDTWFSSWLWPFSTLGWPEKTPDLKKFFPTDTLATGPDIIFFWVARMIMASLEFMDEIPFSDVYFNGMIRDLDGRKMSKSLGNSPDPLWLINGASPKEMGKFAQSNASYNKGVPAYGADAIRLTMVYSTPLGGDVRFDHTMVELGQRFCNKLWNASRFVMMNLKDGETPLKPEELQPEDFELADKWILSRLNKTIIDIEKSIQDFRMNDAIHSLYSFVWTEFCDWYVELAKIRFYDESNPRGGLVARSLTLHILDAILKMLHPIMPFITEEIWMALPGNENAQEKNISIGHQSFPQVVDAFTDNEAESAMTLLQQVIGAVRNIRGEMNIPPAKEADLVINAQGKELATLQAEEISIKKLTRIASITYNAERPDLSASSVVQGAEIFMPLADLIDVDVEKQRLEKEISRLQGQLVGLEKKLSNENFVSRAPADVVEKEKQKQANWQETLDKLKANLAMFGK